MTVMASADAQTPEFRTEHDTMGEVQVPRDALWKAQTQRAVENFPISGTPIEPAARRRPRDDQGRGGADERRARPARRRTGPTPSPPPPREVAAGDHDAEFPIDVFQTGSGTSSNMNANEVIASLASASLGVGRAPQRRRQHVAVEQRRVPERDPHRDDAGARADPGPRARAPRASRSRRKAAEFAEVVKSGRTHLMDATPVTLGQEFGGYAAQVRYGIERIEAAVPRVAELPLGGTAVGTGINMPAGFAAAVIGTIAEQTGLPFTEARNHFEAQGARDGLVEASGVLRTIAVSLNKIANDIRWMGSGPRAGLGEIALPDLQPGSSIMPGKVNPVLSEAMTQVCAQVIGNDAAVGFSGAAGAFELNVMLPVMARNVLESIRLLANISRVFADRCVDGITANVEHCRFLAESSPSIVTPLNRYIGYENAAAVAKQALKEGRTIREVVVERGFVTDGKLTEEQLDAALDVLSMTRPPA